MDNITSTKEATTVSNEHEISKDHTVEVIDNTVRDTVSNEHENSKDGTVEVIDNTVRDDRSNGQKESKLAQHAPESSNNTTRWYAGDDGSFFEIRREPFFAFNFVVYVISIAVFLYFTVSITQDFASQKRDPPTSTKLQNNITQEFPGMIFCNHDPYAELTLLEGYFGNVANNESYDIQEKAEKLDCGGGTTANCIKLNTRLPAFRYGSEDDLKCVGTNQIDLLFDIDAANSNSTFLLGIDGFLHLPEADISNEEICNTFLLGSCGKTFSSVSFGDECGPEEGVKAFDKFLISSNSGNLITLTRTSIPLSPPCNQPVVSWSPMNTGVSYNERLLKSEGVNASTLVFVEFQVDSPVVAITKYNPQSGQSMFGRYVVCTNCFWKKTLTDYAYFFFFSNSLVSICIYDFILDLFTYEIFEVRLVRIFDRYVCILCDHYSKLH